MIFQIYGNPHDEYVPNALLFSIVSPFYAQKNIIVYSHVSSGHETWLAGNPPAIA